MSAELERADLAERFELLAGGTLPLPGVDRENAPFGTATATALSATQRDLLAASIALTSRAELRSFLFGHVTPASDHRARRTGLELLAPHASLADLPYAVSLVEGELQRSSHELEAFVAALLARDPRGFDRMKVELDTRDPALRATYIRAIGSVPDERGMRLLARLLFDGDPHLELLIEEVGHVASGLSRAALSWDRAEDDAVRDSVRDFLQHDDTAIVAAAAETAAALQDANAIRELIALLEHESGRVRAAAKGALVELTGLRFTTPRRWLLWYDAERDWWDSRWPELAPALRGASRETVTALLAETIGKRLERELLVAEVAGLLERDDALVRRLACQSLGQLESSTAVPDLLGAMNDPEEAVARSAWAALRAISGQDLPFDPSACSEMLEQGDKR